MTCLTRVATHKGLEKRLRLDSSLACLLLLNFWPHIPAPLPTIKVEGPTTSLTFLGIVIDTIHAHRIAFTPSKIQRLKTCIAKWIRRKVCRKKELLSLIGSLSHACTVIAPGHIFMQQLITTSYETKNLFHWMQSFVLTYHGCHHFWIRGMPQYDGNTCSIVEPHCQRCLRFMRLWGSLE